MEAKFLLNGDTALSVVLADTISIENSRMVNAFKNVLEACRIEGIKELLPTYCAVMIHYDVGMIRYDQLVDRCREVLNKVALNGDITGEEEMVLEVPVVYGGEWGFDLPEVAAYHNMTEREIVDIHTGYPFYTYMLGFTPGHGYLGSDNPLKMPRRSSPRAKVDRGCIVVMENLSVIEPIDSPNGWNVIGKTPLRVFQIDQEDPFLLKAGLWIKFREISRKEYDEIEKQVLEGTYRYVFYRKEGQ